MATEVIFEPFLSVGGNDISSSIKSIEFPYGAQIKDFTASGDLTVKQKGGLLEWSFSAELFQDFAAGQLDSILFPLVGTGVAVEFRKSTDAVSTSNPSFTGTAILNEYPPFGGSVGDEMMTSIGLASAGLLTRATA